jgi:hypothetical protein
MSTDSSLCFDVITMILIPLCGGGISLATYMACRSSTKRLDEAAAKKAINSMAMNAMVTLGVGVSIGVLLAGMGRTHIWMAAAALLCLSACTLAIFLALMRSAGPIAGRR